MKKLILAAAVSAAASVGAQATTYNISSNITNSQVMMGNIDAEDFNTFVFGGSIEIDGSGSGSAWTVAANQLGAEATLTGSQTFTTGPAVLNYDLMGSSSANGIVFDDGHIDISFGATLYDTIDASIDNVLFDSASNWEPDPSIGSLPIGGINMSGGTINADGTITIAFNGLWTGSIDTLADFDIMAAQTTGIFTYGPDTGLIMLEGELTLTAVPIPAAAWLFGSALMGLAGLKRRN